LGFKQGEFMNCTKHPENPAAGACVYCGKFFCTDCLVEVSGKMYCREDVSKVMQELKDSSKKDSPMVFMNAGGGGGAAASSSSAAAATSGNGNQNLVPIKSKVTAGVLALLLGGLGVHKFYLGKAGMGILYLVFCWTFIPALVALIEAIMLFSMSEQEFIRKYGGRPA